ncbi:MAG TPA: DUF58 domain-containing protein [Abditibacteriaceae bacterium]|jgi:hypothetical protein
MSADSSAMRRSSPTRPHHTMRITLGVALVFTLLVASIFPTPPLMFMAALLAAAPIVGSLAGRFFARGLRVSRSLPTIGTVGDAATGRLVLHNVSAIPSFFVRFASGENDAVQLLDEPETVVPILSRHGEMSFTPRWHLRQRGIWSVPPACTGVFDPLGLFASLEPRTAPHSITVLPRPIPISRLGFLAGNTQGLQSPHYAVAVSDATDFHGIRPWQPGDSGRRVHWKSTARTGVPHIIEWEDALSSDITLLLDTAAPRNAQWLEAAITGAASIAAHVLENGHRFDLFCWQSADATSEEGAAVLCHHQACSANSLNATLLFLAGLQAFPSGSVNDLAASMLKQSNGGGAVLLSSTRNDWQAAASTLKSQAAMVTALLLDADSFEQHPNHARGWNSTALDEAPPGMRGAASGVQVRIARNGDSLGAWLEQ